MEVYLFKKGQRFGPYSLDQVKEYLASGDFSETDLAFFEGCDGWVPITKVPGLLPESEDFNDPDVDYDRQRELEEMFPDFEDDSTEEEEEEAPAEPESASPAEASAEAPVVEPESSQPESGSPVREEPVQAPPAEDVASSPESAEKSSAAASAGRGKRFSLSKAQAARWNRGGDNKARLRRGIPFPNRPGVAAFGWLVFLSLVYGIGVSMMPMPGIALDSPKFVQFSGHLHSLLVHLPVGALILAFPMHLLDRPGLFRHIGVGSVFVLWFAMLGSLLAVFTGYFQSFSGVSDAESLDLHVTTGILVGSGACGSLFLKLLSRRFVEAWLHHLCTAFLLATVVALFINMHNGASLTHGRDYLEIDASPKKEDEPKEVLPGQEENESSLPNEEEDPQEDQNIPEANEE
ncbi:MAG: DUF4339 domain-containing protein [Opitutales bacterium]